MTTHEEALRARYEAYSSAGRAMREDLAALPPEAYDKAYSDALYEKHGVRAEEPPKAAPAPSEEPLGVAGVVARKTGRLGLAAAEGVANAVWELGRTTRAIADFGAEAFGGNVEDYGPMPDILQDKSWDESMAKGIGQFMAPYIGISRYLGGLKAFQAIGAKSKFVESVLTGALGSVPVDFAFFDPVENNIAPALDTLAKHLGVESDLLAYMSPEAGDEDDAALQLENRVKAALMNMPVGVVADLGLGAGAAVASKAFALTAAGIKKLRALNWAQIEEQGMKELAASAGRLNEGIPIDTGWAAAKVLAARIARAGGFDKAKVDDVLEQVPVERHEELLRIAQETAAERGHNAGTLRGRTVEELRQAIPPEVRVSSPRLLEPGPVRTTSGIEFKDLPLDAPGEGLRGMTTEDVSAIWRSSVDQSPLAAGEKAAELGASPHVAEFWDRALRLPNRARYWYEISTESMRDTLPDLTPEELKEFFAVVGATSPQANPYDNMRRALSAFGHKLAGRPATTALSFSPGSKGGPVRSTFFGHDVETNKVHNFGGTFEFLAGLRNDPPLSTNDRQVAKSFSISDKELFQNQALYEPISRFYMNLRDALNSKLAPGEEPYETWQLQALGWVQQRLDDPKGSNTGDDYMMALDRIQQTLADHGLIAEGQPLTKDVLAREDVQRILDPTTAKFERADIATVEVMSERSPQTARLLSMRDRWDDITERRLGQTLRRTMNALATRDGAQPSVASRALDAARGLRSLSETGTTGKASGITRIDYGRGTWRGNINQNIRVPLIGADENERKVFLALFAEGLDQDMAPSSIFKKTTRASKPADGVVRTYSVFAEAELDDAAVKEFSDSLGEAFEVSVTDVPNGTLIDVVPSFGDSGPVGIDEDAIGAAADVLFSGKGVKGAVLPRDFQSTAVTREEASGIIETHLREIEATAVDKIQEITNVSRKAAREFFRTGSPEVLGELPAGRVARAARVRAEGSGLRDRVVATRQEIADQLARQEREIGEIADRLERKPPGRSKPRASAPAKAPPPEAAAAPTPSAEGPAAPAAAAPAVEDEQIIEVAERDEKGRAKAFRVRKRKPEKEG